MRRVSHRVCAPVRTPSESMNNMWCGQILKEPMMMVYCIWWRETWTKILPSLHLGKIRYSWSISVRAMTSPVVVSRKVIWSSDRLVMTNSNFFSCQLSHQSIPYDRIRTRSTFEPLVDQVHHFFHHSRKFVDSTKQSLWFGISSSLSSRLARICRGLGLCHETLFEPQNATKPMGFGLKENVANSECNWPLFEPRNSAVSR